jgi:hypothetical protein
VSWHSAKLGITRARALSKEITKKIKKLFAECQPGMALSKEIIKKIFAECQTSRTLGKEIF